MVEAVMSGELCIHRAQELMRELAERLDLALRQGEALAVDLSQAEEIDSAGIQLLLVTQRDAAQRGGQVRFLHHPEFLLEIVQRLGLARLLGAAAAADPSGRASA